MNIVRVRIHSEDEALLAQLSETLDSSEELLNAIINEDREHRSSYRNYSGRKPTARALILRKAIHIGLKHIL